MLKLTTLSGGNDIVLNPAHIASVRGIPRRHGSAITMAGGKEHEVQESVDAVHKLIEDLRHG